MQEKTEADYRKLAAYFYKSRLPDQIPSPKKIADALAACAAEYRPAYWLKLRAALAFDQGEKGYQDAADRLLKLKNPVREKKLPVKAKALRVKAITRSDHGKLLEALGRDDAATLAAVLLAEYTGVRPAEMLRVRVVDGRVMVIGAKKSHSGQRGADREILVAPKVLEQIPVWLEALRSKGDASIAPIQHRLRDACKALWPTRKAVPTLYTWRHQLGSNLRAAGRSRAEIAYIMGHQSTKSADQYGDKRTSKAGALLPRVPDGTDLGRIRQKHRGAKPSAAPDFGVSDGPRRP